MTEESLKTNASEIAIVGMSIRVPGANDLDTFWHNIVNGVDSITRTDKTTLRHSYANYDRVNADDYIPVTPFLQGYDEFDAGLFGMTAYEAERTDPSQKLFMECCHEALEHSNTAYDREDLKISVFSGSESNYLEKNLKNISDSLENKANIPLQIGNRIDFLSTRVSHRLNLNGPSISVMAACATSLMAIHLAVSSLRRGESNVALAGGASIIQADELGYFAGVDGMFSPTGYLRPFDANADGTIFGNGAGAVVLRPLVDALREGMKIYAVIRGTGASNDGNPPGKSSFTAPSTEGQTVAIQQALDDAGVDPSTIGYIEAHGTGTRLGDPIELESSTQVFRKYTSKNNFCSIGSVKGNIGHLRTASGVVSLIKTCLVLDQRIRPPIANFETINPRIDLENSPFRVETSASQWETCDHPFRASISSFGFGGTNVHAIVESAPKQVESDCKSTETQIGIVSAHSIAALDRRMSDLARYVDMNPNADRERLAHTLQIGRTHMEFRSSVLIQANESNPFRKPINDVYMYSNRVRNVVFLFPGQGSQFSGMGEALYNKRGLFAQIIDQCDALLEPMLGYRISNVIFLKKGSNTPNSEAALQQTANSQPALFVIEYALARELMHQGVTPTALLGHSVGELVAACLAGVFTLEDGLKIVAARGRLMQSCKSGVMAAVILPEAILLPLLPKKAEIAAINGPDLSVVSGPDYAIDELEEILSDSGYGLKRLSTSHAFHSWMMDPVLPLFYDELATISLSPPQIPIYSNINGQLLTDSQATSHQYWSDHIRRRVEFSQGIRNALEDIRPVFLEVGPGRILCDLVRQHEPTAEVYSILQNGESVSSTDDFGNLQRAIGSIWKHGVPIDWLSRINGQQLQKLSLPLYPYQRQRHWIEPGEQTTKDNQSLFTYSPIWLTKDSGDLHHFSGLWVLLLDDSEFSAQTITYIKQLNQNYVLIRSGEQYSRQSDQEFTVSSGSKENFRLLINDLKNLGGENHYCKFNFVHGWTLGLEPINEDTVAYFNRQNTVGYHSIVALVQAIFENGINDRSNILVSSNNVFCLPQESLKVIPEKSSLLGPIKGSLVELHDFPIRFLDLGDWSDNIPAWMISGLLEEANTHSEDLIVARRENQRYVESLGNLDPLPASRMCLRLHGLVFITGGSGGLALEIAEELYHSSKSKLALTTRWEIPKKSSWEERSMVDDKIGRVLTKILKLESKGAEIILVQADCSNPASIRSAVSYVKQSIGAINAVIHMANSGDDVLLHQQDPESTARHFSAKVHGALVLDNLFKNYPLDFFIHFSSLASYYPSSGQATYASANAVLNALSEQRNRTHDGLNCALAWGAWERVGMAVTHVRNKKPAVIEKQTVCSNITTTILDHPLITEKKRVSENKVLYLGTFLPHGHWVFSSHFFQAAPLVAGATITECFRMVIQDHFESNPWIELYNLAFILPLFVPSEGVQIEIEVTNEQGEVSAVLRSCSLKSEKSKWVINSTTAARILDTRPKAISEQLPIDLDKLEGHDHYTPMEGKHLTGSEKWSCRWHRKFVDNKTTWAHISVTDPNVDPGEFGIHPALMDHGILSHSKRYIDAYIPSTIDSVRFYEPVGLSAYTYASNDGSNIWRYNCAYYNSKGEILMDIQGDVLRPISGSTLLQKGSPDLGEHPGHIRHEIENRSQSRLSIAQLGDLGSIHLEHYVCPPPNSDEVKIQVVAAGMNFRDVLIMLGHLPEELGKVYETGAECSGYVVEVGENVTDFSPGDAVMGIGSCCFRGQVNINAHWVALIPDGMIMEHSAGVLTAFLTADYGLFELARLQPKERVLIHAGAGGVGLAAIQLAQKCGAEIFVTAGHEKKHDYLKSLGVSHVFDSRSTSFSSEIMALTNNEGVDVVLNSLSGDFIEASLKTLRRFGRFIEIGKKDLFANSSLSLKPFLNNLSYCALDIGQMTSIRDLGLRKRMTNLLSRFAKGELKCSPTLVVDISDAESVFKQMSKGNHIGKIVLKICEHEDQWRDTAFDFHKRFGKGISPKSGVSAFNRILRSDGVPGVLVLTPVSLDIAKEIKATNLTMDSGDKKRPDLKTEHRPAGTATESFLVDLFETMIGIADAGIDDNFFELGGDSIAAIQIQHAISREFGLQLSSATLTDYPTIAELSKIIVTLSSQES